MSGSLLPAGFAALEPFVDQWAVPSLGGRDRARLASTPDQRRAFYDAAGALAPAAFARLDSLSLDRLELPERRLLDLMLSLAHVALAVELQGDEEPLHARGAAMMPIVHGHADPT